MRRPGNAPGETRRPEGSVQHGRCAGLAPGGALGSSAGLAPGGALTGAGLEGSAGLPPGGVLAGAALEVSAGRAPGGSLAGVALGRSAGLSPGGAPAGAAVGRALLLLLAAVLAAPVAAAPRGKLRKPPGPRARPLRPAPASGPGGGQVESVTTLAAFVNRGAADGLSEGQKLTFTRAGKPAGECVVETLAAHSARCAGGGLRVGDRFVAPRAPEATTTGSAPAPVALPTEAELARRAAVLAGAEWPLRQFDGAPAVAEGVGPRVEAWLTHVTSANTGWAAGPFQQQRLDVRVGDVNLWRGLRASVDLTVLNFSRRPAVTRSAYTQTPVLLVHQLELGFRRADVPFSAALGRTWLRGAPGFLVIDGAQAAWRFGDDVEVGAYGGLLPEAARLTIQPSQWATGAFGRLRHAFGPGAGATSLQLAARAGYAVRDVLGARAELGLQASLWRGAAFDVHAAAELGFGATQAFAGLDAARLDVGARPVDALRLTGAVRYRGLPLIGLTEVGAVSPGQRALHADLGALWEATPWLLVGGQAGLATDFDSGLLQARLGPELSVPRLFGGPVGVGVGYLEELGWVRGRHGWVQVSVSAPGLFRLLTRGSWFQQQWQPGSEGLAGHEAGATVMLEVTPWRFLRGRVFVSGRVPLVENPAPLGSVGVQLGGAF